MSAENALIDASVERFRRRLSVILARRRMESIEETNVSDEEADHSDESDDSDEDLNYLREELKSRKVTVPLANDLEMENPGPSGLQSSKMDIPEMEIVDISGMDDSQIMVATLIERDTPWSIETDDSDDEENPPVTQSKKDPDWKPSTNFSSRQTKKANTRS